jgi:hypothetical protein
LLNDTEIVWVSAALFITSTAEDLSPSRLLHCCQDAAEVKVATVEFWKFGLGVFAGGKIDTVSSEEAKRVPENQTHQTVETYRENGTLKKNSVWKTPPNNQNKKNDINGSA